MAKDSSVSRLDIPFRNLILVGFVGVGKTTVGQAIAHRLDVDFVDIDEQIIKHEGMSITAIREQYGDPRLKIIEAELCHDASLRRQAVVVGGGALREQRNANLLGESGRMVCLTCEMGEALRRLHIANQEAFRDLKQRSHLMSRLRREYGVVDDEQFMRIDTTHLTVDEVADELIYLWQHDRPLTEEITEAPSHKMRLKERGASSADGEGIR